MKSLGELTGGPAFAPVPTNMTAILYKDHLVITVALFDEQTNLWEPHADISWTTNEVRQAHQIGSERAFSTREQALEFIEWAAKEWIDKQV